MSIKIDEEFQNLIPPLSADEYTQLEKNIIKDGIRDALIVWHQPDGNDILIDGHNRWKIAAAHHGIRFDVKQMEFKDRDAVIAWIADNQLGRRNLHPLDREKLLSVKRDALEKQAKARQIRKPANSAVEKFPQQKTRDIIGKEIGVSGRQVDKLHTINERGSEALKQQVRSGEKSINQAYLEIKEKDRKKIDMSARATTKEAEERHNSFQNSKTVSMDAIRQNKDDVSTIARAKKREVYNAIKTLLFWDASDNDLDFSMLNRKNIGDEEADELDSELATAISVLSHIRKGVRRL